MPSQGLPDMLREHKQQKESSMKASTKQINFIQSLSLQIGWEAAAKVAIDTLGWDPVIESHRELTSAEAARLIDALKKVRYP